MSINRGHSFVFIGRLGLVTFVCLIGFVLAPGASGQTASTGADRNALQAQLDALEKEAASLDITVQQLQGQAKTLQNEIKILNDQIRQHQISIQRLALVIRQTDIDISHKAQSIAVLQGKIKKSQQELGEAMRQLATRDQNNLLQLILQHDSLSDFFMELNSLEALQGHVQDLLADLRTQKTEFEKDKADLEDFREGQQEAKSAQELEQRSIQQKKTERDRLLKVTQGQESKFQTLLKQKQGDIAAIRNQLFYLEKTGITAEDALKYAKLAASRTGIRAAFLLGILEVETGRQFENGQITVGSNLGTGNWKRDMYDCYINLGKRTTAEKQKAAFFKITSSLGFDPDKMPVSRAPNYGCGGAMGPAQFIPTTWLLFTDEVARLVGRSIANPWNVDDAFTASALFLADAGAKSQTKTKEIAAARTYISGNPNCPARGSARYACIAYANRVYQISQEIEAAL